MSTNQNEIKNLLARSCEERYDYFLDAVLAEKEIWILINTHQEFLKIVSEEDGVAYLPVWPTSDLASAYAGHSSELTPKCLTLAIFRKRWLPGLSRDQIDIGVIPSVEGSVWVCSPAEFKADLDESLSAF